MDARDKSVVAHPVPTAKLPGMQPWRKWVVEAAGPVGAAGKAVYSLELEWERGRVGSVLAMKAGPRSARKAKGDGHLRRGEILQAAQRIFVEDGYEGATIRKIAEDVGVSSTALYMHFRDKGEILFEICRTAFAQLADQNAGIAGGPGDAVERTRLILDAYIRFGLANPQVYQLVLMGSPGRLEPGHVEALTDIGMRPLNIFAAVVEEAHAAGRLKTDAANAAAQTLWAAAHGLVALLITRPAVDWAPREVLIATMLDAVLDGLVRA